MSFTRYHKVLRYISRFWVSGLDRYYQFARCFRDEDARNERQLVHTQMDMEMSFVEEEDVWQVIEAIFRFIRETLRGRTRHALSPGSIMQNVFLVSVLINQTCVLVWS